MDAAKALAMERDKTSHRRHPRKELRRDIGVLHQGLYRIERTADVSESGISFLANNEIPLGDLMVLTFQIPGGSLISVRIVVKNVIKASDGKLRIGCLYNNIRFQSKREIRNYVSSND